MNSAPRQLDVVVGVDGSQSSDAAVRWAAQEAVMRHVPLMVVHAYTEAILDGHDQRLRDRVAQWQRYQGSRIVADALAIVAEVADAHAPVLKTETITSPAVSALADASKDAHIVVVGSRGTSRLGRRVLGSVSTGLCHRAHCPVAVVHGAVSSLPDPRPILLGIDGSPASEAATAIAFDEASRRGVAVLALHAWSDVEVYGLFGPDWDQLRGAAEEVLAERLAGWQEHYPDVHVERRLACDDPAYWLVEESANAQLVVVGSHGRGGFAGMLLGSVSTAVAQSAGVPVIVARPG